jgi:hypothetical protein
MCSEDVWPLVPLGPEGPVAAVEGRHGPWRFQEASATDGTVQAWPLACNRGGQLVCFFTVTWRLLEATGEDP